MKCTFPYHSSRCIVPYDECSWCKVIYASFVVWDRVVFRVGQEKAQHTVYILLFSAIRVSRHPDAASCRAARRTAPRTWSTLAPVVSRRGSGPRLALCPRVTRDNAREPFFARELPVTGHPAILLFDLHPATACRVQLLAD